MTLTDVELKIVPFTQMGLALKNGAVDAALLIPPFTYQVQEQGLGVMFIDPDDYQKPQPVALAVNIINTDWAAKNRKRRREILRRLSSRASAPTARRYHGGSTRGRKSSICWSRKSIERNPEECSSKYPWQSRAVNGRVNVAKCARRAGVLPCRNKFIGYQASCRRG